MSDQAGCGCDSVEQKLVPYEEALNVLLEQARTVSETERLPLNDCLNRVLAQSIESSIDVPPADNTSMDGYAIRTDDVAGSGETVLRINQRIAAGETGMFLEPGTAARIFTGAPIPPGADAVIMQEQVEVNGENICFSVAVKRGQNIRLAGEDIKKGQTVVSAGTRLRPQELGLAASVGKSHLVVTRRPRIGIFFTGDELVEPGQTLGPGQIYDSNRYTLNGLLNNMGCEIIDLGIVGDTLEQTREAILSATEKADLVITSGGVSVGEEDHVRIALEQLGELKMWRLNIKPGKPLALGLVNGAAFIGLPGNPVSVFATFILFVSPFIRKLQGRKKLLPATLTATADFDWTKPDKRREFARARLVNSNEPGPRVDIYPNQSSGVLMSTSWADGLVVINENQVVTRGDKVSYIPFTEMIE
jgi:molybdopterin molybdotransferase